MKLKMKLTELLCITVLVGSGSAAPYERKEKKVQYAPWEDVNVLAHGLLQLGQSLKEHVDRTRGQMRDVSVKLAVMNSSVSELRAATQHLHADAEVLRARAQRLEEREAHVLNVTSALQERLDGRTQTRRHRKADRRHENHSQGRAIQSLLEAQNQRIDALVEQIKQQQDKLDRQNIRIRALQNQLRNEASEQSGTVQDDQQDQAAAAAATASSCHDLFLRGETRSGLYTLQPNDSPPFPVHCDMTAEGGWTVVQRRADGSVDFDRLWDDYRNGFGNLNGEFWLGLEKIRSVTRDEDFILKIQMSDWRGEGQTVQHRFRLSGEKHNYSLFSLETPAENPSSSLVTGSSSVAFSTRDRDNDQKLELNCAKHLSGGWWFSDCGRSNLNGRYFLSPPTLRHQRKQGAFWKTWQGRYSPLKSTAMMITPAETRNQA